MNSTPKVTFWNSLVVRFGLMFTGLVLICILVVGYLIFDQVAGLMLQQGKIQVAHESQLAQQSFYNVLGEVSNDIAVITNNPAVIRYANDPTDEHANQISEVARAVLANKPAYYQLRIIDVADGMERLRLDKDRDDQITRRLETQLQSKIGKSYFVDAIALASNYYFSEINLNEEFGKVSDPHIPTLRAVGKIRNEKLDLTGLLVINIDLSNLFETFRQISATNSQIILTDLTGQYLYHEDFERCFANQLGHDWSFDKDFDQASGAIEIIRDQGNVDYIYVQTELKYSSERHRIRLVSLTDMNGLLAATRALRSTSLLITLVVCALALLFIFIFTRFLSQSINLITKAVSDMENDKPSEHLIPVDRKDEVGLLARSFMRMKIRLDEQMSALKEGLAREQQAVTQKNEFLQNMSHDLRTPLNAILGLTQLLQKNNPTEAQEPILESLHRSTVNLSGLMHDVLDQHKLMEGKVTLKPIPSNVDKLLQDIFASYQYDAISKGLKISYESDDRLKSQMFLIDPMRFNQIVSNVLVNAIKYTNQGCVSMMANMDVEGVLVIKIVDTGIGIESEKQKRINDRFYQAHQDTGLITDGFGLGLSIVKQLLMLFGGELTLSSKEHVGSEFSIEMPLIVAEDKARKTKGKNGTLSYPVLTKSYRVLHVEDDKASRLLINNLLEIKGVTVTQVSKVEEAMQVLRQDEYHLILSDVILQADRVDATTLKIWKDFVGENIIILSALEPQVFEDSGVHYFQKPVDTDQLMDVVVMLLGQSEYERPWLDSIRAQYDYDEKKITKYLELLANEFQTYISRLEALLHSKDGTEWKAIIHKLITHVRQMRLSQTEPMLDIHAEFEKAEHIQTLVDQLRYSQCCIQYELRAISDS